MTFAQAAWLLALLILPLLVLLHIAGEARARRRLAHFASERLLPGLLPPGSRTWRHFRFALSLLAVSLIIAALARPQHGETVRTVKATGADVVFAIDVSRSMMAADLPPDRLTRAKLAVQDLLEELQGNRVGLVAFAGTAFLQCPLTLDYDAFRNALVALEPGVIPTQGTNLAAAIAEAQEALTNEGEGKKFLVLMTDGEDLEAAGLKQAREVDGVTIITIGVGTAEGGIVPDRETEQTAPGQRSQPRGQTIISHLDPETLEAIASATGGFYSQLGGSALLHIQDQVSGGGTGNTEEKLTIPHERFQWPLALALLLLFIQPLVGLKRSSAVQLLLLCLLFSPGNDLQAAESEESSHDWRITFNEGIQLYKEGRQDEAIEAFQSVLDQSADTSLRSKAAYNAGTGILKQIAPQSVPAEDIEAALEKVQEAKQLLETALGLEPDWQQARDNFLHAVDLIKELESMKPPPPEQEQSDSQEEGDQEESNSEQQQSDQGEGQQDQGESEEGESQNSDQGEESQSSEDGQQEQEGSESSSQSDEQKEGSEPQDGSSSQDESSTGQDSQGSQDPSEQGEPGDQADQQQTPQSSGEEGGEEGQQTTAQEGENTDGGEPLSEGEQRVEGQAQPMVLELTREEAERLLRTLQREEKVLPAGRMVEPVRRGEGRDW